MSPKTLSAVMDISESEAASFIDSFKSAFPDLRKFISTQIEKCRVKGYIETIRKRRRCLPNINNKDYKLRTQVIRINKNTFIKSSFNENDFKKRLKDKQLTQLFKDRHLIW